MSTLTNYISLSPSSQLLVGNPPLGVDPLVLARAARLLPLPVADGARLRRRPRRLLQVARHQQLEQRRLQEGLQLRQAAAVRRQTGNQRRDLAWDVCASVNVGLVCYFARLAE